MTTTDQKTLIWTNAEAEEEDAPTLVYLRSGALYLAKIPDDALDKAAAELSEGKDIAAQTIPLTKITLLSGDESDAGLSITYQLADKNTDEVTVTLADSARRDELLAALAEQLGPTWTSERKPTSRLVASLFPLGALIGIVFLTWFMHAEAEEIAAGKELPAAGRTFKIKMVRDVMHWVEAWIGTIGVLILGGLLASVFVAWLVFAIKEPPLHIRVFPRERLS